MKKIIIVILLLVIIKIQAQQTALFNTYSYDLMQLNIASIGRTCVEANLNYRTQWIELKEAPKLYQLNAGIALGKSNGIGIKVAQQNAGLLQITSATFGYAYRVKLTEKSKLHLGLGLAWQQNIFNANKAIVIDNNDLTLTPNPSQQRSNNMDVEAGALFLGDKLTLGVSALHLYNTNSKLNEAAYKVNPQINTVLAYKFNKGKGIEIEPWLVNRYTLSGTNQIEGMVNFKFKQAITIGGGYRLNYGIMALAGIEFDKFKVAYSFDYGNGTKAKNLGSSHQILLGFDLCKNKTKKTPEPIVETPTPTVKTEPVVVKEEPKKEEPIVIKEQPKKVEEPIQLNKKEAALKEIDFECESLIFDAEKYSLPAINAVNLNRIANLIIENDLKVNVLGYASKDGNAAANAYLSKSRANYVKSELIKRGVKPTNITPEGVGDKAELFDNSNEALKGKNRTIRITDAN